MPLDGAIVMRQGIFADHDRMTEKQLRWMGPTLKGIAAPVACIAARLEYNCTVEFLDGGADAYDNDDERQAKGYRDAKTLPAIDGEPGWRRHSGSFIGVIARLSHCFGEFLTGVSARRALICVHARRYSDRRL